MAEVKAKEKTRWKDTRHGKKVLKERRPSKPMRRGG